MNVYLGIDWSQMKHDLCWMNEAGAVVAQQTILHSVEGFAKLDEARHQLEIGPELCWVGIETAHSLLIDFLWARRIHARIHPGVCDAACPGQQHAWPISTKWGQE